MSFDVGLMDAGLRPFFSFGGGALANLSGGFFARIWVFEVCDQKFPESSPSLSLKSIV